jgi:hypothetical protein
MAPVSTRNVRCHLPLLQLTWELDYRTWCLPGLMELMLHANLCMIQLGDLTRRRRNLINQTS